MNQYLFIQDNNATIETSDKYGKAEIKAFKKLNQCKKTYVHKLYAINQYKNGYIFTADLNRFLVKYPSELFRIEYCRSVDHGKKLIESYLRFIGKS